MARKPRLEWEGASYHIMARGNSDGSSRAGARARIFTDETDYALMRDTLEESLARFGVELHAWVLMPNHYHLAVSTPRANLSRWMAWLQTTFTARYNRRHRRVGHLFQGRYRAEIVDADPYARTLVLYIHLNPIRRRLRGSCVFTGELKELEVFRWSGHLDLSGQRKKPLLPLSRAWGHYWATQPQQVPAGYRRAIQQTLGFEPEDWKDHVQRGLVAGGPELMERVLKRLWGRKDHAALAWKKPVEVERRHHRWASLFKQEKDRAVVAWVRVRLGGEPGVRVARDLGYQDGSGVTHAIKRIERLRTQDAGLSSRLRKYEP